MKSHSSFLCMHIFVREGSISIISKLLKKKKNVCCVGKMKAKNFLLLNVIIYIYYSLIELRSASFI